MKRKTEKRKTESRSCLKNVERRNKTGEKQCGECCRDNGELARLERLHLRSLKKSEAEGDPKSMARDYGNLGNVYLQRHKLNQAEQMYRKALDIQKKLNNREWTVICCEGLGSVYLERDEYDRAEKMYLRALKTVEEIKDENLMQGIYFNLGVTYRMSNKLDKAEEVILKSLKINERMGKKDFVGIECVELGKIYKERGDRKKWLEYWQRAAKIFTSIGVTKAAQGLQEKIDKLRID